MSIPQVTLPGQSKEIDTYEAVGASGSVERFVLDKSAAYGSVTPVSDTESSPYISTKKCTVGYANVDGECILPGHKTMPYVPLAGTQKEYFSTMFAASRPIPALTKTELLLALRSAPNPS